MRIALISATSAAISPAVSALAAEFPEADPWNILDDKLLPDAANGVTPLLEARMRKLISYAAEGADAVLLTCSMYGFVAAGDFAVAVLAPDEAAFEEALAYHRVLVVASLESALRDTMARLEHPDAIGVVTTPAGIGEACLPYVSSVDAVLLAQYSLAPHVPVLDVPVISGPRSAAVRLRSVVMS